MEKVINLGMPHVGALIFKSIDTSGLISFLEVSETWKVLAENVLVKRWKGKMYEACKRGETKVVQLLLERCNPEESGLNIKDWIDRSTFMVACEYGHQDVVQLLLNYSDISINLNTENKYGETALLLACQKGHKDVVQLLLDNSERNIDLNARNNLGWTAFMYVCKNGHKDVVKLLLKNSKSLIDLNARSNAGSTAFMFACKSGDKDVVKILLENSVAKDIDISTGREELNNDMKAFIDKQQIKR